MAKDIDSANNTSTKSITVVDRVPSYINITSTLKNDIRPMNGPQNAAEARMYADTTSKSTQRKVSRFTKDNHYNQSDS